MELHERLSTSTAGEVSQPQGDPFAELKNRIHLGLIDDLGRQLFGRQLPPSALAANVVAEIRSRLQSEPGLSREDRERLVTELTDDIIGHGPLERLLADDTITEIMVNGPFDVWIEREGRLHRSTARFTDESHLRRIINKMVAEVGRRIDESQPMVDARLPDGSRINALIPPLSLSGALLTIRKFGSERLDLDALVRLGTLSAETTDLLRRCVQARLNLLISGGTGAGKTTLLNALSAAIPDTERIITIEDAAELRLAQRHVLRLECRMRNTEGEGEVTIRDLVRNSLRMRPDRIVVGETRGAEALDMLQALNTGHDGSLSTIHANSPRDALARLETMVLMAGYDLPLRAIRQQVAAALDLIIQLERAHDGSRKVIAITEVQRMESDVITLQDLYRFKVDAVASDRRIVGELEGTGLRPGFLDKFHRRGVSLPGWLADGESDGHGALRAVGVRDASR
jgi:pilus assembly protein CpaF